LKDVIKVEQFCFAHCSILASRINLVWALINPTAGVKPVSVATWVIRDCDPVWI